MSKEPLSFEEKVNRLHDRTMILETIYAYCHYNDQLDAENVAALFTDDCQVNYRIGKENTRVGKEALHQFLQTVFSQVLCQSHYITNVRIHFESENVVIAHMYMHSQQRFKDYPESKELLFWGRYDMRFVRVSDGEWKISCLRLRIARSSEDDRVGEHIGLAWPSIFEDM